MNYQEDNERSQGKHKGHSSHMIWMVLCCAIPLVLFFALPLLKIQNAALNSYLRTATSLICPLMMVFMMIPMFMSHRNDEDHHSHNMRQVESVIVGKK
jgi:choline-glycine betaine transporter